MKAVWFLSCLLAGTPFTDGINDNKPVPQDKIVYLYPEGQGVDKGIEENGIKITSGPGADNGKRGPERTEASGKTYDVGDKARMEIYFPEKSNGLLIITCPGGSYAYVSAVNEGYCAAEWLLKQGCIVCNMFYRPPCGRKEIPLRDVQNALRYCRHYAAEWGVDKIGVMGSSAGGHLAASAAVMYEDGLTRPDFSILLYPVIMMEGEYAHGNSRKNLLGENVSRKDMERYSLQKRVSPDTPVTFIALSADDNRVSMHNSMEYFSALRENGVKSQMHIYPIGGHGWGFARPPYRKNDKLGDYRAVFEAALSRFIKDQVSDTKK